MMTHPMEFTCPPKFFLLGEYSVLFQGPALLVPLGGKRFSLKMRPTPSQKTTSLAPFPEWEKLWNLAGTSFLPTPNTSAPKQKPPPSSIDWHCFHWVWKDPFASVAHGGLGSSSAKTLLTFAARSFVQKRNLSFWPLLKLYQTQFSYTPPPSGADLATQWIGGNLSFFYPKENILKTLSVSKTLSSVCFYFFLTSNQPQLKTHTFSHIKALSNHPAWPMLQKKASSLSAMVLEAKKAFKMSSWNHFATMTKTFTEQLSDLNLEHPKIQEARLFFQSLPGVLCAKGSGALLSDAFFILAQNQPELEKLLFKEAKKRNWIFLQKNFTYSQGLKGIKKT